MDRHIYCFPTIECLRAVIKMKPTLLLFLVLGILALMVCPVAASTKSCAGIGTCIMNQTANMTAGPPGADNMTANMTAGPAGATGPAGAASTIDVNFTFTGLPGSSASVTNVGTTVAALLDFTVPQGATGAAGTAATIDVNATFVLPNNSAATVTNIGTSTVALLDFGIPEGPRGAKGDQGVNGTPGNDGAAATVDVNATFTGSNSTAANVTNVGNTSAALLDFTIPEGPRGAKGDKGEDGIIQPMPANQQVLYSNNQTVNGSACMLFDNSTGTFTACYLVGDGSGLTNVGATAATALTFPVKEEGTSAISKGQVVYVSGGNAGWTRVGLADNTNTAKSRVVGLMVADVAKDGNGFVRRAGILTDVDTRSTNTAVNPLGQTWIAGDLLFATTGGGMTNIRPTSGRSVKVAYSLSGSAVKDTLLAYPLENPVWITAASSENVVLRLGDSAGADVVSVRNYANTEIAYINSLGNASVNGINANWVHITNVTSSGNSDAVNKSYVDSNITATNVSMKNYVDTKFVADDDGWNASYFLKDASRAITGTAILRNVNSSYLSIGAGTGYANGTGADITVTGSWYGAAPGAIYFTVPNAAKTGYLTPLVISGGASPRLTTGGWNITGVNTITVASDVTNKTYVDHPVYAASAQSNALCYDTATKTVTYNSGVTTCLASTEKTKTNITSLTSNVSARLMLLKPSYYTSQIDGQQHYGLVAEEIATVFPELAAKDEWGNFSGVRYEEFTAVLLKGYQEQQVTLNNICANNPKLCEGKV